MTPEILSAEVSIYGYTMYRIDRMGGRSHGGCAVYVRDDLTVIERDTYSNNYCESQVLEIRELELLLINIYRPPSAPKQLFEDILNRCQEIITEVIEKENTKAKTILGVGDYNFPFIKWPSNRIYSRDKEPAQMASEKEQAKMLLEWAEQNFMDSFTLQQEKETFWTWCFPIPMT
jgi:exonuclease III